MFTIDRAVTIEQSRGKGSGSPKIHSGKVFIQHLIVRCVPEQDM